MHRARNQHIDGLNDREPADKGGGKQREPGERPSERRLLPAHEVERMPALIIEPISYAPPTVAKER